MSSVSALAPALARIDFRNIIRDPLLRWFAAMPIVIAAAVRFGAPALRRYALPNWGLDIADYYLLFESFMLLVLPLMAGMIIGFLLLDQKEDGTLSALRVTPLSPVQYMSYRLFPPVFLSAFMTIGMVWTMDLRETSWPELILCSLASAPIAPAFAMFLAVVAQNKVQGFALTKVNGIVTLPPLAAYFIPNAWHWLCGLVPTFWPVKAYWVGLGTPMLFLACLGIAVVFWGFVILWLVNRFNQNSGRTIRPTRTGY